MSVSAYDVKTAFRLRAALAGLISLGLANALQAAPDPRAASDLRRR